MFFVWKEIKRCTNRCTVYLFSFVPENIQPKMIPNIRYFAPTWCALFPYFIPCGTLPIASKYGDECNKRRHIHRSILGTFFLIFFHCFYFSICIWNDKLLLVMFFVVCTKFWTVFTDLQWFCSLFQSNYFWL